jgi:bla regulator protein blaR1
MANTLANAALAISSSIELSIIVKATVILVIALAVTYLARGGTKASVRHLLLAFAFGVLLLLPVAALLMPPLAMRIPIAQDVLTPSVWVSDGIASGTGSIGGVVESGPSKSGASVSAATILRVGWAIGLTLFMAPLMAAYWRLRRVRYAGVPWPEGQALARRLAIDAGVHRFVDIVLHDDVAAPMTGGLARPLIVLPCDAPDWSEADIQRALVHELEHVYRADWPVQFLARGICSLYWFHPLVWMAWRHLCLESERACDDAVLSGRDGAPYADQLVRLARRLLKRDAPAMLAMASRSNLSARVAAVLDASQRRGRAGGMCVTALAVTSLVLLLLISPLAAFQQAATLTPVAQTSNVDDVSFEVASIKPNPSTENGYVGFAPGGRFEARRATLQELILLAFGQGSSLRQSDIIGGPRWITTDRFDIEAKAESNPKPDAEPSPQQMLSMIRRLLAHRFHLAEHFETRELPIYALTVVNKGRLGPRLRRSEWDCSEPIGSTGPPTVNGQAVRCRTDGGAGRLIGRGMPIARLVVGRLPALVGRAVVDRTGLTGGFDWDLEWTPANGEPAPPPRDGMAEPPRDGPWIFTALEEQLGLKLEPTKGPVQVLIIDRVQQLISDDVGFTTAPSPPIVAKSQEPIATVVATRSPDVSNHTFEVASIKPNNATSQAVSMVAEPNGRFTAVNIKLPFLIRTAYRLQDYQIVGAPNWLNSDRFDILAKFDPATFPEELLPMMQSLLADRFSFNVHFDRRELPIFALTMADANGRLGPQLRRTECPELPQAPCTSISDGSGRVKFRGIPMEQIVQFLAPAVGRVVIDRTGLNGRLDMDLEWTPESTRAVGGAEAPTIDGGGVSIFTAVQEQLGLRLESTRGLVEVLVIDNVEHPTPD